MTPEEYFVHKPVDTQKCVDCSQEYVPATVDFTGNSPESELCDSCYVNFQEWLQFRLKAVPMDYLTEKIMGLRGNSK